MGIIRRHLLVPPLGIEPSPDDYKSTARPSCYGGNFSGRDYSLSQRVVDMSTPNNPFEIAREALKQLATRRIAPTPDNYLTLYHEIAGTRPATSGFPEQELRALSAALPRATPDQLRLAKQLEDAVRNSQWQEYRTHLGNYVNSLVETQKLNWSELIADLLKQLENKHVGLTSARKREGLERVLSSGNNPETLHTRLRALIRSWGDGKTSEDTPPPENGNTSHSQVNDASPGQVKELLAFTLDTAIAAQLIESPQLASDARSLASEVRNAQTPEHIQGCLDKLKRFAFKLELLSEDQNELRQSLLGLLRLLIVNITELVLDDHWLHGQIEIVRDIIDKPLSQRALDDAQRRLKEVLFKQSQLKASLKEAKEAIKHMLAGFVDHLADMADATSEYHDKIEHCATKISAANNITELENVIAEVMRETRAIQINTLRSRDDLRNTQTKVRESEARIEQLEKELAEASDLVRHDQLTGALNRRGLEEIFTKELSRARRHETALCVTLLDIDNFKKLNDTKGHAAGDQALVHLAAVCRETLRPQDTIARFGGEEFIILLPETSLEDASKAITRLQRELTRKFFLHDNDKVLITFSAGVTELRISDTPESAIQRADEAMYEAKQTGKNRVVIAQST